MADTPKDRPHPPEDERKDDDVPDTPPTEPPPVPIEEPPADADEGGPFIVQSAH